jgi:hypothetical protein
MCERNLRTPKITKLSSLIHILNHYFGITYKVWNIEYEQNLNNRIVLRKSQTKEKFEKISYNLNTEFDKFATGFLSNRYKSEFDESELIKSGAFVRVHKFLIVSINNFMPLKSYLLKVFFSFIWTLFLCHIHILKKLIRFVFKTFWIYWVFKSSHLVLYFLNPKDYIM